VKVIEVECVESPRDIMYSKKSSKEGDCCVDDDKNGHKGVTRGDIGDNKLY